MRMAMTFPSDMESAMTPAEIRAELEPKFKAHDPKLLKAMWACGMYNFPTHNDKIIALWDEYKEA